VRWLGSWRRPEDGPPGTGAVGGADAAPVHRRVHARKGGRSAVRNRRPYEALIFMDSGPVKGS
jgi:hypothetical protein